MITWLFPSLEPTVERLAAVLSPVLQAGNLAILLYFLVINTVYLAMLVLAAKHLLQYVRGAPTLGLEEVFRNPFTPGVTILVPAYNEGPNIVTSVTSLLGLRYPDLEVVVVNDGSKDDTLDRLVEAFELEPAARVDPRYVETAHVAEVYRSRRTTALTVVDKANGGKADALNAALNFAERPLVCAVDADAILEPDALLRVVKPFLDDPADVVAVGGIIRIANGCTIEDGRVVDIRLPRSHLVGLQVMEYLRAYLIGRTGWSEIGGLLIISGAFGLFRRDAVLAAGGYDRTTVGEDAELVVRLHRRYQEADRPYRIAFVPDPVCWTEAPESARVLARQRRRWQRGLWQTLTRHKRMAFNPRYGVPGALAYPYQLLFEAFGPLVEGFGYVTLLVSVALGLLDVEFAVLFLSVAVLYGWLISSASVLLEEVAFRRYRTWRDIARLLAYALFENAGYRQLHTWWRLRGILDVFRDGVTWGDMERQGLGGGGQGGR